MVFKALKYGYASTRSRAMKQKLLSESLMKSLLQVNSASEVIELLEEKSTYRDALIRISQKRSGLDAVKLAVRESIVESCRKVVSFTPKSDLPKLKVILSGFEANSIKLIISCKALGINPEEPELVFLSNYFKKLANQAISARELPECIEMLGHYDPQLRTAFKKAFVSFKKSGDFKAFLNAVDEWYYSLLSSLVKSEREEKFSKVLKMKIEFINIMTILRMKKEGAENSSISKELVKVGNQQLLLDLMQAEDVEECMEILKAEEKADDKTLVDYGSKHSLIPVEVALEKKFAEKVVSLLKVSGLDFSSIVAFVFLKQIEAENIRKIAYAVEFGLKEEVSKMVFAV